MINGCERKGQHSECNSSRAVQPIASLLQFRAQAIKRSCAGADNLEGVGAHQLRKAGTHPSSQRSNDLVRRSLEMLGWAHALPGSISLRH